MEFEIIELKVSLADSGMKLADYLLKMVPAFKSIRSIKSQLDSSSCEINGRTEKFGSRILGAGDAIKFYPKLNAIQKNSTFHTSQILFEDSDLIIYDKPSGLTCDEKGVIACLKPLFPTVQLVHRLDRETSGLLILSKNSETYLKMVLQFKEFQIQKEYLAIVDGEMKVDQGVIENYLIKKQVYQGQTIWGASPAGSGLYSKTTWYCKATSRCASIVSCHPKTGRTHQIRVHMAEMGHPILGDYQYGKKFVCQQRPERVLLHAVGLNFNHPRTRKNMTFSSDLPIDFNAALRALFPSFSK